MNHAALLGSVLVNGIALGSVYASVSIAYNVMFSVSRVMSFTAGPTGMLGGVLGAFFITSLGWPAWTGFLATVVLCAALGLVIELVAVRPVLAVLERHLYVLSTLAFALIVQQFTALTWSTEPQAFPRLLGVADGLADEKFWLPVVACFGTLAALELFYGRTLTGRAFTAVAEDNFAARAIGLPERRLRVLGFAIAGAIGGICGFASGQLLLAFYDNATFLTFYGFMPVAMAGLGHNRGAVAMGLLLGLFQQANNFLLGGVAASVAVFAAFILVLLLLPGGVFTRARARRV